MFGEFEDLLHEKDVMIPSSDMEGHGGEARLYGSEYYRLEDAMPGILAEETSGRGKGGDSVGLLDQ